MVRGLLGSLRRSPVGTAPGTGSPRRAADRGGGRRRHGDRAVGTASDQHRLVPLRLGRPRTVSRRLPYDHPPQDPDLAQLREPWLFPTGAACQGPDLAHIPPQDGLRHCTRINRPAVHTIYPPVAEAYFLAVDRLSPAGARHKPLQIGAALISIGVTGLLLLILRRRGDDLRKAAYWAWCPAVPWKRSTTRTSTCWGCSSRSPDSASSPPGP
ncbi:hypothetical protein WKI68_06415 [Streptomyces sp. MS1.HAVA.3]|uniref:Uncharacterized protein n=1 Tax=Streptomyces caledonius TaxID=3134107 RepID=A0ABU8U118_9ACTN